MPDNAIIARLADGATVITATAHLAWVLRQRFDQHQLADGKRAWESADVLPYPTCVQRIWQRLGTFDAPRGTLLNDLQLASAWQRIIRADLHNPTGGDLARNQAHLWNTHATARSAIEAWRILHAWNIGIDHCAAECAKAGHEDHQRFLRWARRFERLCAERGWIDAPRLAARLSDAIDAARRAAPAEVAARLPEKIVLAGFDSVVPQQQTLLDALTRAGVEIENAAFGESINQRANFHHAETETTQWLRAAQWGRAKLLENPTAKIAIIAPNLDNAAPAIDYALRQILSPRQLAAPATSADLPYHLSLGRPLGRYPVARAALIALAPLSGAPLSFDAVGQLLRSPFIHGADAESIARAQLDAWLARRLPYQIRFTQLLKTLLADNDSAAAAPRPRCPRLVTVLRGAAELLPDNARAKPASDWAHLFAKWLDQLGWPGERALDSDEFQAARAFRQQLQSMASLDLTAPPMGAATALSWLRRRLDEQPFQVEARNTPVQVLSVPEAAGQHFDGIWFGGLSEADWPPAQRINPFIAARLQRDAGVPAASIERNREHAEQQQQRLIASGAEVVLCAPRSEDGVVVEISPLVAGLDEIAGDDDAADTPANIMHAARPQCETFVDARGPAFARGEASGGVSVIANQAKCAFRAFAIHRLGARRLEKNAQGLAASERGSLIHRALQLAWEKIQTSENLHALGDQLDAIIRDAVEQAGLRYAVSSGCGAQFHETQARWACATLHEWFENEKTRAQPFTAAALEVETKLNLNKLELTFKLDRVDQLKNGALALFDYKTGAADGIANWVGARPQSPQLPLYALAQDAPIETIAYGRVRRGDCGFTGISRDPEFDLMESNSPNRMHALEQSSSLKNDFDDWDALLAHWRETLSQLAQEFLDGEARVAPHHPSVCTHCDLHGLCRIGAGAPAAEPGTS